ncbi:MAG: polysaccharide biosynthesis tyrosine autokinase [Woeseia sp.]
MSAAKSELAEATRNLRAQQGSVSASIRNEYESAVAEEAALLEALAVARLQYQTTGSKESELNALQREVDANRKLYELFYNRIGETDVTGELESAQARIVSPAVVPSSAIWPDKRRIVGLAFLLTVLAGISVAVLLEAMNNTIRSSADVEEKLQQDLLGMVPLLRGKGRQRGLGEMFFDERQHGFGESFRTIRTAVSLDNLEHPHKIIIVTSSIDREGKSTVAMNLAHAFARGEKVLLLDADMRRPSIGRELKLPKNALGFAELLDGSAKLVDCVVTGEPGRADILPHGHIPQDPQKLLSSTRLVRALLVLKNNYDRIIIDTPPVLPVSDALMLSKQADAVIVVAKSDATSAKQINQALHFLARVDARVIGVVVNQLDIRKAGKYSDYGYGGYYDSYESPPAAS